MGSARSAGDSGAADVLSGVPVHLWHPLVRAVRRAVDDLPRGHVPAPLRPYAGWKPDRLLTERPRRAIVEALGQDARLRERVGGALQVPEAWDAAEHLDALRLAERFREDVAVAALAARGRWSDIAVLAAAAVQRLAATEEATAEPSPATSAADIDVEALARERDELRAGVSVERRRAEIAEGRARELSRHVGALQHQLDEAEGLSRGLEERLDAEQRSHRDRLARLHRQVARAESRARAAEMRARDLADALEAVADFPREGRRGSSADGATEATGPDGSGATTRGDPPADGPSGRGAVPRDPLPATPGRPCRLPPGLHDGEPAGVHALLRVPGIHLFVDGYNVSMNALGRTDTRIDHQRAWLLRLTAGVAARYAIRPVVVFDGDQARPGQTLRARGVLVVFSEAQETADERIVALVASLAPEVPVLVVSSDREVQAAAGALCANATGADTFLAAVGA